MAFISSISYHILQHLVAATADQTAAHLSYCNIRDCFPHPFLIPCSHMGQFLQGGKNGRLMSFFLAVQDSSISTGTGQQYSSLLWVQGTGYRVQGNNHRVCFDCLGQDLARRPHGCEALVQNQQLEERGEEEEERAEKGQLVQRHRRKSQRLSCILPYDTGGQAG